jgi:large subunit ribosomal protein L30
MAKAEQGTVRIKWVRSGIAFNRSQSEVVRSLGLRRLHQVVERQDTPVVRGLIAKVPHLVEVVGVAGVSSRATVPEYTIIAAAPMTETPAIERAEPRASAPAAEASEAVGDVAAVEPEEEVEPAGGTEAED